MASAEELRARIDELSQELERQNRSSKISTLEHQRSVARCQLNGLVDPVARLPLEISSDIFHQCLSSRHDVPTCSTLLRVCHAWNDIALATPSLWNDIVSADVPDAKVADFLQIWLPRSRSLRFTLTFRRIHCPHLDDAIDVLRKHAHRLQTLLAIDMEPTSVTMALHALKSLTMVARVYQCLSFPLSTIVDMLRAAPNLESCHFASLQYHTSPVEVPLTCASLRDLRLSLEPSGYGISSAELLLHLTLPALETLYVSQFNIDETEFLKFLIRSSPPLRLLYLWFQIDRVTVLSPGLVACLQTIPSLTDLELLTPLKCSSHILDTLAATPALLPNLQNITIHGRIRSAEGYPRVVNFLASRRATMRRLRLVGVDEKSFFEAVGPGVREFVDDGIDIVVGLQEDDGM
ncbi:hypothetical protein FB45DRAFT_1069702 [Roridomyces roridus]|uniref:F-box domain-containing protein n=1 Tax=Roridomyces roridus TaxID=1738132 RepID=A0AAD7AZ86_9AGAR|nr:hypothetical protein FB45DRAFT_1069702 [Roridomyces roridus]